MSLLPSTMLPYDEPIGLVDQDGRVNISKNYWLLIYNLCLNVLGNGSGLPADALQDLAGADIDAADSDSIALRQPIRNLERQVFDRSDVVLQDSDLPSIYKALLLAQDDLLPDPIPRAQPVFSVTPGTSPWTYTALFPGSLLVAGGTVSAIALIRQGMTVATGLTAGLFPVSRYDELKVTYSGAPTVTFIPGSSN